MPEIKAIKKLHEYLENPQNITKPGLKGISDNINRELRFLSKEEQEKIKELYKNELTFLNEILKAPVPSEYIAKNPDAINSILKKDVVVDEQEHSSLSAEPEIPENSKETISIYKKTDVISSNLEQLQECMGNYIETLSELKLDENEENIISRLMEIEDKVKPIYDYFHNGSAKFQKNSLNNENTKFYYTFFTDLTYDSLDLLNSIKFNIAVCEEHQISSGKETLDEKKIEEKQNDAKQRISECYSYYKRRHAYYSKLYEQTKDEKVLKKIKELEKTVYNCEKLYGELEKNGIEKVEPHKNLIEEQTETKIGEEEYYSQEQGIKQEEQEVVDENVTLDNDEYFESLLGLYGGEEEEKQKEESYLEIEEVETVEKKHPETFEDEDTSVIKSEYDNKKEFEWLLRGYNPDMTSPEFDTFEFELPEIIAEEQPEVIEKVETVEENANPVLERISDMIDVKGISSKEDIQKELDNIYSQMLAPKEKKRLFKREKTKSYGDINEDLFMDIRRVFTKISIETEVIDVNTIDKFAQELFEDGNPKYLFGEIESNTQETFSNGIAKYIEISESGIFTEREKENFEKFVIKPYMLRNMQGKEKDFFEELQEDTFSQEDIVKNLGISRAELDKYKSKKVTKVK